MREENKTKGEFISELVELRKRVAELEKSEVERKRSEEALQYSQRFLKIANRHTQIIPLLKEFVAELKELTGCAAVGIRILGKDEKIPYEAYDGFSQRFYDSENLLSIKSDQCMCVNVVKGTTDPKLPFYTKGGSFYMNGTTRFLATVSEEEKGKTRNVCNQFGYESVALVPIRFGGQVFGLIHVADPQEKMASLKMVEILERVAMELGMAIQRVMAEEAMQQAFGQTQQHEAEVSALLDSTRAVLEFREFEDTARSIFDSSKHFIGATAGYVALLNEDGMENEVLFLDSGNLPCTVDPNLPMPIRGLRGEAYRTGKTVYDNGFPRSEWVQYMPEGHARLDNVLFAPLTIKGKAVGLIGLANKPGGFNENDARMASAFGELTSIALYNSRNLEELKTHRHHLENLVMERTNELKEINEQLREEVDERKKAEEILQLERNKLKGIHDAMPDGVYIVNQEFDIEYINPVIEKEFGSVKGLKCYDYFHDRKEVCHWCKNQEVFAGKSVRWEWNSFKTEKTYDLFDTPLKNVDGSISKIEFFHDITERKGAEEALRNSEELLRLLIETLPIGAWVTDKAGKIIMGNPAGRQIWAGAKYVGIEQYGEYKGWWTETGKQIEPEEWAAARAITKGEISINELVDIQCFDGTRKTIYNSALPIRDLNKNIIGCVIVNQDITERRRAEQETASLQDQLRQSQKVEAIGQLAGGIAHDFNNLLTIIQGNSQLSLMDLQEGDPLRANIEEIQEAAKRAADLTRQLLAFSRKQILEMRVLDLNQVLKGLDKMLRRVIGEDIELTMFLPELIWKVKADPGQLEQVIMNLSVNARDAMPEGGKLTIETANVELDEEYANKHIAVQPGRYVMLSVSDTGAGMTPEVRERIFEPFFTTKEKGKGTGLGLSTVYGIVKQSGGNIWVYSEPGQGTTFKIYLPQVDEPVEELREEVVKEISRGHETILLVEDEDVVRRLAVRVLKRQGYKVLEASDGGKAFMLCEAYKEPIHLILTDVVMPGMSGSKLVRRLNEIHPEMKALYMSGYTDNAILHHGILEPGINFIQKPFTVEGLARKVREVLDK